MYLDLPLDELETLLGIRSQNRADRKLVLDCI